MTHQRSIESVASYALDALGPEERAEFEAHLADCRECQAELVAYRQVAGVLAYAAPPAAAPDGAKLRERILREARTVRPMAGGARGNGGARLRPGQARSTAAARWAPIPWVAAAASLAAAVVIAFVYRAERQTNTRLRSELAAAEAALARDDSTLAAFVGPEVHVVSLAAPDRKPAMRVFWNHTRRTFVVTASGLPPAPAGRTYQLWALRKGESPLSMGTFDASATGPTMTTLAVPPEITNAGFIDDCALTVEPAGGSPTPTESPRLVGSWRHVD